MELDANEIEALLRVPRWRTFPEWRAELQAFVHVLRVDHDFGAAVRAVSWLLRRQPAAVAARAIDAARAHVVDRVLRF